MSRIGGSDTGRRSSSRSSDISGGRNKRRATSIAFVAAASLSFWIPAVISRASHLDSAVFFAVYASLSFSAALKSTSHIRWHNVSIETSASAPLSLSAAFTPKVTVTISIAIIVSVLLMLMLLLLLLLAWSLRKILPWVLFASATTVALCVVRAASRRSAKSSR